MMSDDDLSVVLGDGPVGKALTERLSTDGRAGLVVKLSVTANVADGVEVGA